MIDKTIHFQNSPAQHLPIPQNSIFQFLHERLHE